MSRVINKRSTQPSIVIIVDGEDEKWYLAKLKEHYPSELLKHTKLKPEMCQSKKCKDLFDAAKVKIDEEYSRVILILDFDTIRGNTRELNSFRGLYARYLNVKNGALGRKDKWMTQLLVVINNPCLEYWFLLHFKKTNKFYPDFASLKQDLKKIPELSSYDKSEDYYYDRPDIFDRLGACEGINNARKNSAEHNFCIQECCNKGVSEMRLLLDFFDGY